MVQKYNIKKQVFGDTFNGVQFTYQLNNAPIDLTAATIKIQVRKESKTGEVVKTLETGSGITITDATNGVFSIDSFVIDIPVGINYYDIQLTTGATVKTYVEGIFEVLQDVTQ